MLLLTAIHPDTLAYSILIQDLGDITEINNKGNLIKFAI